MTCAKTGATFTRGEINSDILKKSCE